jgi:tetratricopeptide (TPR) repeat protein
LRNYQSTLALSRSDLAISPLVTPTLVKDESSPTAEERGHALRLVLQWAVNLLAPAPTPYPLGQYRPLDDPTWHDPRWWGYNILRHRYLEPLHPDDFVEGGRYTESLLALTGISSSDAFFDERQRAIRAVAERLRQQLIDGQANHELQRLALQEALLPLAKQSEAMRLLGIAATFDDIFPRSLLLEITTYERLHSPATLLSTLIIERFLLTGDEGQSLWLSPVLRRYVYELQSQEDRRQRHRRIAAYYEAEGDALRAARHWQQANENARAVRVLLPAAPELIHELQVKALTDLLQRFEARGLEESQWYRVQLLLSDLFQRSGQFEDTLTACRRALQATTDPTQQARVYRRMGKLYESRNQAHALRYYQQAVERFATNKLESNEPEFAELLKDRGWLYFYRQEWENAETDLQHALQVAPADASHLQADILDAMANLKRKRGELDSALAYAESALAIREQVGDLLAIAKSLGNLGFLYRAMNDYHHAVLAHQEALTTYEKLGNKELIAAAWLNIGASHYHSRQLDAAIHAYRQSLEIGQAMRLPLIELKAHYNLAEAFAATDHQDHAARHWSVGYQLCQQHNFADQASDFVELAQELGLSVELPATQNQNEASGYPAHLMAPLTYTDAPHLNTDEEMVMELVRREHNLTARRLMVAADISRATATRRLTSLVEKGLLTAHGQGRGAYYALAKEMINGVTEASTLPQQSTRETLHAILKRELPALVESNAVTNLGILTPYTPHTNPKIVVRFAQSPDLATFFTLKQSLATLLHLEIELLPAFTLSPAQLQNDVEWI